MVNIDCRLSVKYGQVQDVRSPRYRCYRCPGRNPRFLLPLATVVSRSAFAELANCFRNHRGLVTFRWCEDAMENCSRRSSATHTSWMDSTTAGAIARRSAMMRMAHGTTATPKRGQRASRIQSAPARNVGTSLMYSPRFYVLLL